MTEEFIIVHQFSHKYGCFLCFASVVMDGKLNLGAKPLIDLSENALYYNFLDALRNDSPLPEALPRRFKDTQRPALREAFERFQEGK